MCLIGNGMQTELGSVEATSANAAPEEQGALKLQSLDQWCGAKYQAARGVADVFGALPLDYDLLAAACLEASSSSREGPKIAWEPTVDEVVDAAREASLASFQCEEERQLARVLAESRAGSQIVGDAKYLQYCEGPGGASLDSEDAELQAALRLSTAPANLVISGGPSLHSEDCGLALALAASRSAQDEADDASLQAALRLSTAPSALVRASGSSGGLGIPWNSDVVATIVESDSDVEIAQTGVGATNIAESPYPKRHRVSATMPFDL
jgi:hypothetical protein